MQKIKNSFTVIGVVMVLVMLLYFVPSVVTSIFAALADIVASLFSITWKLGLMALIIGGLYVLFKGDSQEHHVDNVDHQD